MVMILPGFSCTQLQATPIDINSSSTITYWHTFQKREVGEAEAFFIPVGRVFT